MPAESSESALPAALLPWLEQQLGGPVASVQRMVVRREAWRVEIGATSGAQTPYFLRIDRASAAGKPYPRNLKRETGLIRYLCEHSTIPTQKILGWNDALCVAIQSFEPGRADLHNASREEQHAVMLHFMEIMAQLHRIDAQTLDLPQFERPRTAEDHSLMELRAVDDPRLAALPIDSSTLLGAFAKRWLVNHVPHAVERTVLLQGDTGPGNFLFHDHRVTVVVDWEWAHFGDPMEDVGNLWVRDFFTPSCAGDLTPYVEHYARLADLAVDRQKAIYYLVHQLARSVIAIPGLIRRPDWKSTVALNLGYQTVCDSACCEAIALYHGINEDAFEPLAIDPQNDAGELYLVLAEQLEKGVLPHLENAYARNTTQGAADIARYLERLHLYGPQADNLELAGINAILGARHARLDAARGAFRVELQQLQPADEVRVLRHCQGIARRNMQLMEPLVQRWNHCKLARLG